MLRSLRKYIFSVAFVFLVLRSLIFISENSNSSPSHHPFHRQFPNTPVNLSLVTNFTHFSRIHFDDTPAGPFRSRLYNTSGSTRRIFDRLFTTAPRPILTVITITRNPRPILVDTARSVLQQTLHPLRWLIVNDRTDDPSAFRLLHRVVALDRRIVFVNNTRAPGFCEGRLHALRYLKSHPTRFFSFLDDDDLFELTFYEKCIWALYSVRNASACGSYVIGFGSRNYTWTYGFHSGARIVADNPLTGSEILRTAVLKDTNCTFDSRLNTGMEDWDFYLCLARGNHWGITVPEYLTWYRQNPEAFRKARWKSLFEQNSSTAKMIRERYKTLLVSFPDVRLGFSSTFTSFVPPFQNKLPVSKGILVVLPWLINGYESRVYAQIITALATTGSHVTVLTLFRNCDSIRVLSAITPDVVTAANVAHASNIGQLLSYMIDSRSPQAVLLIHAASAYAVVPPLSLRYKKVAFVDVTFGSKDDAFHSISRAYAPWLTASVSLSANHAHFNVARAQRRAAAREHLRIPREDVVVVAIAHGGWSVRADVLASVAKETSEWFLKHGGDITAADSDSAAKEGGLKIIVVGVDKGSELELQRLIAPHRRSILIIPEAGPAILDRLETAADVICAAHQPATVAIANADRIAVGSLGHGVLWNVKHAKESGIELVSVGSGAVKDAKAIVAALRRALERAANRKVTEVSDVRTPGTRDNEVIREETKLARNVIAAVKRVRPRHTQWSAFQDNSFTIIPELNRLISDTHILSDINDVQHALRGHRRGPFGEKYRIKCGEYNEEHTMLVDLLESATRCEKETPLDVGKMQKYALEQCARWCIMDLSDDKRQSGWWVRAACGIEQFNSENHKCTAWYRTGASR